jgi:putative heme-binding domain-containing protein
MTAWPDSAAAVAAVRGAERLARDSRADPDRRADAIALLALAGVESRRSALVRLVDPREPEPVQIAALRALTALKGDAIARQLLSKWPELTAGARSALVDLLLAEPARQRLLVAALREGSVQAWAMSFWQKRDLLMHEDPEIRTAARALLEESPERRADIVNRYAAAVDRGGDPAHGEQVFARACAACHHVGGGTGADVGPDLATVRHRPPLALLIDILSPSQSIAQGYETYVVRRTNGRTEAGTLSAQAGTSITLRQAGARVVIPRREIKQLSFVPQSTMPAELDKVIGPEEMADLLAFLTRR